MPVHGSRLALSAARAAVLLAGMTALVVAVSDPDPLDLPGKIDAGMLFHPPADGLTERLDVGAARTAEIDQEIAVHLGDLGIADAQAPAAGGIDQLPSLFSRRILEG